MSPLPRLRLLDLRIPTAFAVGYNISPLSGLEIVS